MIALMYYIGKELKVVCHKLSHLHALPSFREYAKYQTFYGMFCLGKRVKGKKEEGILDFYINKCMIM